MVKWISLATVVAMMLVRSPRLFVAPRFWAEEGTYFFAYAHGHSWVEGVTAHHFSYFSLFQNLSALVASRIPLEYSPFVTVYGAWFFQVATCAVIILGENDYLRGTASRLFVAGSLVFLASGEVWLSTNATQYWLCVATFFILLDRDGAGNPNVARKWFFRIMLGVGGLNGIVPSFLTPLFWYKAWRERGREAMVQAGIVTVGALVQAGAVLLHQLGAGKLDGRMASNQFAAGKVLLLQFAWPYATGSRVNVMELLGQAAGRLPGWIGIDGKLGEMLLLGVAGTLAVAVCVVTTSTLVAHRSAQKPYVVGSFLLVFGLSTLFAIYMTSSPRYVFAPAVMLFTVLVKVAGEERRRALRAAATAVLLLTLFTSARPLNPADYFSTELPAWRDEVGKWRRDPTYPLRIWPSSDRHHWFIRLESPPVAQ